MSASATSRVQDSAPRAKAEDTVTAAKIALCSVAAACVVVVRRLAARMVRYTTKQKTRWPRLRQACDEDACITTSDVALRVTAARVVVVRRLTARMACYATKQKWTN